MGDVNVVAAVMNDYKKEPTYNILNIVEIQSNNHHLQHIRQQSSREQNVRWYWFGRSEEIRVPEQDGAAMARYSLSLLEHWANSACQSSKHSPIYAGKNAPVGRTVPVLTISNEPVAESALASQHGASLQQNKQYGAVREQLRLHVRRQGISAASLSCSQDLKISLLSFRAIINHFNPKIESYAAVNHISQLSEDQVSQACDDLFSCWSLQYWHLAVPCAHWDWWSCSNMRSEGGTLVFLVQVWARGRETRLALATFTITCGRLGPVNAEGWLRMMKICSVLSKCGCRLWGCWCLERGRRLLAVNLVIGELLGVAWFSVILGN